MTQSEVHAALFFSLPSLILALLYPCRHCLLCLYQSYMICEMIQSWRECRFVCKPYNRYK